MFCPNCGGKLNGNEEFCPNCGSKITKANEQIPNVSSLSQNSSTISEAMAKKSSNFVGMVVQKIKTFVVKYKRQCLIGSFCLVALIVGFIVFKNCYGFEKLSWNETYSDLKLEYVMSTNIKLGINYNDSSKLNDIKYNVNCGKAVGNGLEVDWDLTESSGKCKITASYKLRKISKEFTVIKFHDNEKNLYLDSDINLDSDEDLDLDGLTNKQEKEYKTNPELSDTDLDGINDYDEIFVYKTDPNKEDTDGDGLRDYDEIKLGLDPLKEDSKGDGVKDGKRNLTYEYLSDGIKISITGTGNIASTVASTNSSTKISSKVGLIDNLYTFYTDGNITEAIVTITYTDEQLEKNGLNENNLSVYYYNEKKAKYEKVDTTIDKDNNTVTAKLKHFSNYVIGDTSLVRETTTSQILFVLDNSWSMYTNEQYQKFTGKEYSGNVDLEGFDADGVRFTLTSKLISRLSGKNYQMGLSEFRRDYANALEIGSSPSTLKSKLSTMNGSFITSREGTNITNALDKGIREFSKQADNKYIVLLTDGQDSSLKSNSKRIIKNAINSNVKICSIGFGGGSYNDELSNISNGTGCEFYSSSNALGLVELFENIGAELNDDLIDIDGDGKVDGVLIADSGFTVNKNGFSFSNYTSNLAGGHCYGMATFAELYYKKVLPLTLGNMISKEAKSRAYNLNNTYFKNYDNLYDYKLKSNTLKYIFGFDIFGENMPSDLRVLNGKTLVFNDKYKKEISASGIYDIAEDKSSLSSSVQLSKWGVKYKTVENICLNEDRIQTSSVMNNEDVQLFNAIYASYIKQYNSSVYSSGMDFFLWVRDKIGTENVNYSGAPGFIRILEKRLNDKDAPVIMSNFSGGLHAINAISLVQDIENPNYFYIGVYDNNYPGEKRYVDIRCNNTVCSTVKNNYYSGSHEHVRITESLAKDLEYYNN